MICDGGLCFGAVLETLFFKFLSVGSRMVLYHVIASSSIAAFDSGMKLRSMNVHQRGLIQ